MKAGEGIVVEQPDGSTIRSVGTGYLKWKFLPRKQRLVHIFKDLTGSLLSIGLLCDAGFEVTFKKHTVSVNTKDGQRIIEGARVNKLWMLDINDDSEHMHMSQENGKTSQMITHQTHGELVRYAHTTMGAPANPTFITAISKGYIEPPGITVEMVRKNMPNSVATAKGHLQLTRQGIRSTKQSDEMEHEFAFPKKTVFKTKYIILTSKIISTEDIQGLHADLAGRFPYKSRRGKQYVAVLFSEETNYIHFELLCNRTAAEIARAYKAAIEFFEERNINTKIMHLDGETSDELESYIKKRQMKIQFCPPSNHRTLKAERSVQTAKNHIISSFCTADPAYPMHEWDLFFPQIELTLNLMRGSSINPTISAWHHVHGPFKWTHTPIAPIGMKVLIHERAMDRKSWAVHGKDGFYVGPKMQHYRCYDILVTDTGATRTSDTIAWFPKQCIMPGGSPSEIFTEAINDLKKSINNLAQTTPNARHSKAAVNIMADSLAKSLNQYRDMFHTDNTQPKSKGNTFQRVSADKIAAADNQAATDTHTIQRVSAIEITAVDDQAAMERHTGQRVPIAPDTESHNKPNGSSDRQARVPIRKEQDMPTEDDASTVVTQDDTSTVLSEDDSSAVVDVTSPQLRTWRDRKHKSKSERKAAARTVAEQKKQQKVTSAQKRPVRTKKPIELADGTTLSLPTKHKGTREVVKKLKEQQRTRHQVLAAQANAKKNKPDMIIYKDAQTTLAQPKNFKAAMHSAHQEQWEQANYEEFQRFEDTETLIFINKTSIPKGRKVAYYNPQIKQKTSNGNTTYRIRGTIGGDKVDYPGMVAANTADLKAIKLLLNSVLSTRGGKFMTIDIKDFYLGTTLPRKEYMRIASNQMSKKYIEEHGMENMCEDGYYYVEIAKGIYGLPQAGLLAQEKLIDHLQRKGYNMAKNTPCLFTHKTRKITFTLVVDDFGIKYVDEEDAKHLITTLEEFYKLHIDWEGGDYVGITLEWDYQQRTVALSMPEYVQKALVRLGVVADSKATKSPMVYEPPRYGQKVQYADDDDPVVDTDATTQKRLQQIVGIFLYYARAIDYSVLPGINCISTRQSKITEQLKANVTRMLAYMKTYPDAKLIFKASKMELVVHSDASYLCETGARSRAGGIMWMGDTAEPTQINGAVTCISKIIDAVVASAGEAEYGALFMVGREAASIRTILTDMGHPQPATPIKCDNACAVGIANSTMKMKHSKAMDMRFHWIRDRVRSGQFVVSWIKGSDNLADFFTKPLPVHQHQKIKKILVHSPENTEKANAMRIMLRAKFILNQ